MKRFLTLLAVAGLSVAAASTAQEAGTHTKRTTVQSSGSRTTTTTKTTTITGEVVRIEPGHAIILRGPDSQVATYTLAPGLTVPAEVTVGRKVTIFTEPSDSWGAIVIQITTIRSDGGRVARETTRVTTESITAKGERTTSTERTETSAAGEAKTKMTTASGTVTGYEPGKTITLVGPKRTEATYGIDRQSDLPSDLGVGKTVTIRTTTAAGSQKPVIRKLTYTTRTQTSKKKSY